MDTQTKQAKCKQALSTYKELSKLTAHAQVKMLELLMHPECEDSMALEVIHTRRKTMEQMRQARNTLVEKLYEAGMPREASFLAEARI